MSESEIIRTTSAGVRYPIVTPHDALKWARIEVQGKVDEEVENLIAECPYSSLDYARLLRKPFRKGEPVIAKIDFISVIYAIDVLNTRFCEAEYNILKKDASNIERKQYEDYFNLRAVTYYEDMKRVRKYKMKPRSEHERKNLSISLKDARKIIDGLELSAAWDKTEIYYLLKEWVDEKE